MFSFSLGGGTVDSERIRILPSSTARGETTNQAADQHTEQCSSFTGASISSATGYNRKRTLSNEKNNENQDDRTFYEGSFSLSPSDLDRSWKQRRTSMNGRISANGIRRTKSECKISIHRNAVDNTYIDENYGIMPSESASQKV